MGGFSSLFGKRKIEDLPARYIDPTYTNSQAGLADFGSKGLTGQFNDYYSPIGEVGGTDFQNMVDLNTRDIMKAGSEQAAAMGIRGSRYLPAVTKNVADMTKQMRYADFVRAMSGRQSLLNTSIDVARDVRNAASDEMASQNAYNLSNAQYKSQQRAANDARIGQIINEGLSLAGTVAGFMVGGPAGGAAAASLLSSSGSRGSVMSPNGFISSDDVTNDPYGSLSNFGLN